MNKVILTIMLILSAALTLNGKTKESSAFFSGNLTSDLDKTDLQLIIYHDPVAFSNPQVERIQVDKNGQFDFTIHGPFKGRHSVRITLQDIASTTILINHMPVEAGDNIILNCHIESTSMDLDRAYGKWHPKILKRILFQKLDILEKYKSTLTSNEFRAAKIDLLCKLKSLGYDKLRSFMEVMQSDEEFAKQKSIFYALDSLYPEFTDKELAVSPLAGRYLEAKCVREMMFNKNWKPWKYEDYYNYIKKYRKGLVRDKIIAYTLLTENLQFFYDYLNYQDYDSIVKDAIKVVQLPILKKRLNYLKRTRLNGASPFNFSLPADSTGNTIRLSDFKGKVVLIDMWSYICTGCYMFANTFHKEVYPLFKDNPNFKVISILRSDTPYENYLKRLRNEIVRGTYREPPYTFPQYINLFGGRGIKSSEEMSKYYRSNINPFIILIGKNGKIFSSRIPFFINSESDNVSKLISLIRKALSEPGN